MRLLLVADLHYSLPQFDWVLDYAVDFDVVVMAVTISTSPHWSTAVPRAWRCANISIGCGRKPAF